MLYVFLIYSMGSHKATNVADRLKEIFTLFGFDTCKVSTLIADNASNMKKLAEILKLNYYGCFAHLLNLIVNKAFSMCFSPLNDLVNEDSDEIYFEEEKEENEESEESEEEEIPDQEVNVLSLKEVDLNIDVNFFHSDTNSIRLDSLKTLKKLFQVIRKIVGLFNSSSKMMEDLLAQQESNPLHPIQDVKTRWNSLLMMLERFIVLFVFIKKVFLDQEDRKYEKFKKMIKLYKEKEMKILTIIVNILKPFLKVTEIISSQSYATSSLIIHSIFYLRKKLSSTLICETSAELQKTF